MSHRTRQIIAAVIAIVVVVGLGYEVFLTGPKQKTATAYFPVAIHVYPGSNVDVLGVKIGTVKSVQPQGTQVKVVLTYDASRRIPAAVSAAVVEPTLVADRVVQLTPVYTGGPVLADNAVIPLKHNEVPVELDQLNQNLYQLTQALGPSGANKDGALSRAVTVGAANLNGEGAKANSTVRQLSDLVSVLNDNRGTLISTVNSLQSFTATLAAHDAQTRGFATELAKVSTELNNERSSFSVALHDLGFSLGEVATFIHDNRQQLTSDVQSLSTVTNVLAKERTLLAHIVDIGAVGVSNYPHMYTPSARTFNARFDFNSASDNPALFVCQAYGAAGGSPASCLSYLKKLQAKLPPLSSLSSKTHHHTAKPHHSAKKATR
jgi:phospholipid/cholesterol/gamma-HCH transport system substrate-binding protein